MKKFLAMILVCMMALAIPALAESDDETVGEAVDEAVEYEAPTVIWGDAEPEEAVYGPGEGVCYQGRWITVTGADNACIDFYLPYAWSEYDVTAENEEAVFAFDENAIYASAGGNGTWGMYVVWTETDAETDAASLQTEYVNDYEDAEVVDLNGVEFVRYTDAEKDAVMLLWPRATGMYTIAFGPASDTDITEYIEDIVRSVVAYEAAAE